MGIREDCMVGREDWMPYSVVEVRGETIKDEFAGKKFIFPHQGVRDIVDLKAPFVKVDGSTILLDGTVIDGFIQQEVVDWIVLNRVAIADHFYEGVEFDSFDLLDKILK